MWARLNGQPLLLLPEYALIQLTRCNQLSPAAAGTDSVTCLSSLIEQGTGGETARCTNGIRINGMNERDAMSHEGAGGGKCE